MTRNRIRKTPNQLVWAANLGDVPEDVMNGDGWKTAVNNCNVFIICSQPLLCEGLRLLLVQDEDIEVVGASADADTALLSVSQQQRDVRDVILIVSLAKEACVTVVQVLKADRPDLPVLILSLDTRPEIVQAALAAGVTGYLPLSIHPDELIQAILTTHRGELVLHPDIVPALFTYLADLSREDKDFDRHALSPRQQDVLACLARGLSDWDIAQELFISVRTVQTHLAHIYAKLGVHSRTEAAVLAVRAGWFPEIQPDK